jgi:hypothetical protein
LVVSGKTVSMARTTQEFAMRLLAVPQAGRIPEREGPWHGGICATLAYLVECRIP